MLCRPSWRLYGPLGPGLLAAQGQGAVDQSPRLRAFGLTLPSGLTGTYLWGSCLGVHLGFATDAGPQLASERPIRSHLPPLCSLLLPLLATSFSS